MEGQMDGQMNDLAGLCLLKNGASESWILSFIPVPGIAISSSYMKSRVFWTDWVLVHLDFLFHGNIDVECRMSYIQLNF